MTVLDLLERLQREGAVLTLTGDRLQVDAPAGRLGSEIVEALRARKQQLLKVLRSVASLAIDADSFADAWRDWVEFFLERAAIREYDGGQAREHAEAEALDETIMAIRRCAECVESRVD